MRKLKFLALGLCASSLTACLTGQPNYNGFQSYYTSPNSQPYVDTRFYSNSLNYNDSMSEADVPDSYHVGALHAPTSHKEVDRTWVNSQNPQGYTIQLGESEKASQVASKLYKTPKTDRSAEIKYSNGSRTYYKGVYGSYSTYEEAQKALNNLPPDIQQGAGIKNWSSVQENSQ